MFENMTNSMGQAFCYYNEYTKTVMKAGKTPVSFMKFLLGKY